ncbi:phosphohistidine phosphatase SixA [Methylovorus glucosotrophus]|uniref:Putative phosphohistidine phosphatase, SixA n=2 Tax=Methylophilaceae TaxID=32011 RepID=C6XAI2_METGS|nr:putative phosphohistidine phosphatase, SixA [Methylovorus glucosotrophus SIP3-4]KAF0844743.1 phosphohistidine phosphatase SixA [Methylovorus glucosotrophus]
MIRYMDLILWRHAEADDTSPDITRALTANGKKQAAVMGEWLRQHLPPATRIIVSPATRTQQTALALGMDFTTVDALAPGAAPHDVLQAAGWPKAQGSVLVVGHQPSLGMAAALAMSGKIQYWCVKKGNIWWLSNRQRAHEDQTILRAVISPDHL